jgi:hypothetical protein
LKKEKGSCHSKEENTVEHTVRGEELFFMPANPQIRKFLYLEGEKAFISGLAEVLSLQKILCPQIANPQITNRQITKKNWVRKSVKCQICGIRANLTNYLGLQLC